MNGIASQLTFTHMGEKQIFFLKSGKNKLTNRNEFAKHFNLCCRGQQRGFFAHGALCNEIGDI